MRFAAVLRSSSTRTGVVAAAALALYLPSVRYGFTFDDHAIIVGNPLVHSLRRAPDALRSAEWSEAGMQVRAWRPLTTLSFSLQHAVADLEPWSYHLVNAVLHAAAAVLVLTLASALGLTPCAATCAALLFALHPIHVEAVVNVVGRRDVLATVLSLAAVLLHRRAVRGSARWGACAALACAGAMLSKEIGIVAPALVLASDLAVASHAATDRPALRRRLVLYASYGALGVAYLAAWAKVNVTMKGETFFADNPISHAAPLQRVLTAVAVIGKGLALQLLPMNQSPDYSHAAIAVVTSPADPRFLAAAATLAAWAALGIRFARRTPIVLLALAWYLLALLPVSNLLFPIGTIFGERLLYLPSVGTALLAGVGADALAARFPRHAAVTAVSVLLAASSIATIRYASAWSDDQHLFEVAAEHQPDSFKVHYQVAVLRLGAGRPADAFPAIRRAIGILPDEARLYVIEANVLDELGRIDEEESSARRALALGPGNPDAMYVLGRVARERGDLREAESLWEGVVRDHPEYANAWADLATARLVAGDLDGALERAERAIRANPEEASAWYAAAVVWKARGDVGRARHAFERFAATGTRYEKQVGVVRAALARGELP